MLAGKRLAVFGLASQRSIAWGIANAWYNAGAQVAIGYQSERFKKRVEDLTKDWTDNPPVLVECDVAEDRSISEAMKTINENFEGRLDGLCHSVATSTSEAMQSDFVHTKRQDFLYTLDVSCYSMVALTREALPLLRTSESSSVIGLSFLGGERAIKNYKVMGPAKAALEATCRSLAAELGPYNTRVNCISPGPIQTPAARGIPGFLNLYNASKEKRFLENEITIEDVGDMATFLASDSSKKVTGQTLYVDGGYSASGL